MHASTVSWLPEFHIPAKTLVVDAFGVTISPV
jgi:hypothetical protein